VRWQNPWAWSGLLFVALPMLVHLFSRRPARVESFPSLRFLEVSRLLPTRRTQLTDRLLLLVRIGIVALAVAALAQPLWRADNAVTSALVTRAIVIDTMSFRGDSVVGATVERTVDSLDSDRAPTLHITSAAPREVLEGAVGWLQTQHGRAELIVVSDFRRGALDSLDLLSVPSDITVRLLRVPVAATPGGDVPAHRFGVAAVRWAHALTPSRADVLVRAVRALGGVALIDTGSIEASAHRVIVASPGADSLQKWLADARPLSAPWMGDVVYALRRDTTLASVAAAIEIASADDKSDVVVVRDANGSPVVTAAAINGTGGNTQLLLVSRVPAEALVTAALLLSASRTSASNTSVAGTSAGVSDATPSDVQLRRWEQLPAAVPRTSVATSRGNGDSGPSDARVLWLAVLLLLGIETLMRRRVQSAPGAPPTSAVTNG